MGVFEALFLGIFQGITEFLPVSSSGHLVLAEYFFQLPQEQLLPFDAILHGGTLLSLLVLFFGEIKELLLFSFRPKKATPETKTLFFALLVATVPVLVVGFLAKNHMEIFRSSYWVAIFFLLSALLFVLAERFPHKKISHTSLRMALVVGIFQIVALLPGMSRSGTCAAAGMLMGVSREKATRFAFLLGIPVIAGAFLLASIDIFQGEGELPLLVPAIIGFFSSAISGFFMAKFLLSFFKRHSLYGFALYLIFAASAVFIFELF